MDDGQRITPEVEEFLRSARGRDSGKVAEMLNKNPSLLNSIEAGGFCALHFAAFNGDIPMLELLLSKKPDVNLENYDGNTPLIMAAKVKQHEAIKFLVDAGADINFMTKTGVTAAHHAASMGNPQTVRFLASLGATINHTKPLATGSVLHWAAHSGDADVVGCILHEFGVPIDTVDVHGGTPLFIAVHLKKSEVVTFLLEQGANPNKIVDESGETALHIAVEHGLLEDVKTLLSFGADPNVVDKEGKTPISIAQDKGHAPALKELLKPLQSKEKRLEDAARFKAQGNKVFAAGENHKAAKFYTLAISLEPSNQVYFSNRAACYFNTRNLKAALWDACRCIQIKPDWPKGYFRKAATLNALGETAEAEKVIAAGLKLDASNGDLLTLKQDIEKNKKK